MKDNGYSKVDYVCGWKGEQSHAWLEAEGIIIDITADQFDDIEEAVIVTSNKGWHKQFIEIERRDADFSVLMIKLLEDCRKSTK